MRLIGTRSVELVDVIDDVIPVYAILSHTWGNDEVSFQDFQLLKNERLGIASAAAIKEVTSRSGYKKIRQAAAIALENGYEYLWIDTCCIDKTSSAELSEAINSMFLWYRIAGICYAFLNDVKPKEEQDPVAPNSSFRGSRWFTRGWTLQELIAPHEVIFFSARWTEIGRKTSPEFCGLLSTVTGVDDRVLQGSIDPADISVANRMRWAAFRQTTRREDIAYCLMGIFNVNMPLLYGEGPRAFIRLREEIMKETDDQSLFAWKLVSGNENLDSLYGLLASSPRAFAIIGNIRPLPPLQTLNSFPSSMTNQGLRLSLYLQPAVGILAPREYDYSPDDYVAFLDCSVLEDAEYLCPAIVLRKLWGDQFARVRIHRTMHLQDPRTEPTDASRHSYRRIFVRQKPRQILPDFTISSRGSRMLQGQGFEYVYRVQEVYPPERWDPASLVVTSRIVRHQISLAVLLFADNTGTPRVDVAVGLKREQGMWKPWCQQSASIDQDLRSVYQEFYKILRFLDHQDASVTKETPFPGDVTVTETTRHGRPFIMLEVVEKPEILGVEIQAPRVTVENQKPMRSDPAKVLAHTRNKEEDLIKILFDSCCVADSIEVSLFPDKAATTKVRVPIPRHRYRKTVRRFSTQLSSAIRGALGSPPLQLEAPAQGHRPTDDPETYCHDLLHGVDATHIEDGVLSDFHGFSRLHFAAAIGNPGLFRGWMRQCIKQGEYSALGRKTTDGMTVLHLAALVSLKAQVGIAQDLIADLSWARLLLEDSQGEEAPTVVMRKTIDARTTVVQDHALHFAAAYGKRIGQDEHGKALGVDELFDLLLNSDSETTRLLYGHTASLRVRNRLDETPLHRAAAMGNIDAVLRIVRSGGADIVGEMDALGRTALWHAAVGGHASTVEVLIGHGALVNLADNEGRTPLHAACREGHTDVVALLLNHEASVDAETCGPGFTPAHFAALFGRLECLSWLQGCGATLNHELNPNGGGSDKISCTPLHLAAANGHQGCVELLLGDDVDTSKGCTHYVILIKEASEIDEKEREVLGGQKSPDSLVVPERRVPLQDDSEDSEEEGEGGPQ